MSSINFLKYAGLVALGVTFAHANPTPLDPEANIELNQSFEKIGSNSYRLEWDGVEGTAYFTQWSLDLEEFFYLPEIDLGTIHDPIDFTPLDGEGNPYPKMFVRLQTHKPATLDPKNADFDGDGISNWSELTVYGTDPLKSDSDGDGLPDGQDDSDFDGLSDTWERMIIANSPDPDSMTLANITAAGDNDSDGVSNWIEYQRGLSGYQTDSDGDGYSDRLSVNQELFLRLDESTDTIANDDSGETNHGTAAGSPVWQPDGGVENGGLKFAAGSDALTIPAEAIDGLSDLTMSLWFKTTAAPVVQTLFSAEGAAQAPEIAIDIEDGDTIRFTSGNGNSQTWDAGRNLANGLWHHVVILRDSSNGLVSLWLDGQPFGAAQAVTLGALNADSVVLGQRHLSVSTYDASKAFNGTLDEVRIWSVVIEPIYLDQLFKPNDLDLDGLPDDYEDSLFGNLTTLTASDDDLDEDGFTNREEFDAGTNPDDFYNGVAPVVTLVSGSGQTVRNGESTVAPLIFYVSSDGTPAGKLVNAPINISHLENIGGIKTFNGDNLANPLSLKTNSDGNVSVYFKAN